MIKAITAYEMMCNSIQNETEVKGDPLSYAISEIDEKITESASEGRQETHYDASSLTNDQLKAVVRTVRNEGYLVQRENNWLKISW